ncbi:hypothetical protein GCM10023340_36710 [Nocardioides marinquilinus]|uniref:DUF4386 family protein n=1 Tax=Nocardioides marinquilinus TaxID=1210400 RepID=A0ABP9Q300_9ACTN
MTTQITTHNPVRSDLPAGELDLTPAVPRPGRGWAVAGVAAALSAVAGTVCSFSILSVYDDDLAGDAEAIAADLGDKVVFMVGFHVFQTLAAVLMAVFALGLFRRLRAALPADSLLPALAAFGLLGTSVVVVLGAGLDTEFAFAAADEGTVVPEALVVYNHWIGTIPAVWVLTGLTGLALFGAARQGALARWVGLVGLVLGGLSLVTGVSPLQYMAGLTGTLMLLVVAAALALGDRAHRA